MTTSKIAIVHEWVEKYGGAEAVLDELMSLFPDSELYVLWSDYLARYPNSTKESFLADTFLRRHKAASIPFQLIAWRILGSERKAYEKIVISSHLFAHHAKFTSSPEAKKYVYAHTPARYIWEPNRDSRGRSPLVRAAAQVLKPLDRQRSKEAFKIAANSEFTREKINLAWERDADVIYPPVKISQIQQLVASGISLDRDDFSENAQLPSEFILGASRFIDYKKLDKVINIGEWLNLPVVIAGSGPLLDQLREQAAQSSTQVTIIESPSDILLLELYSRCLAYVFPGVEDFGVMPLEASAAGAPVLANHIGGTSETILEGANGAIVDMQSKSEILSGFSRLQNLDRSKGLNHISKFDTSVFKKEFSAWVSNH